MVRGTARIEPGVDIHRAPDRARRRGIGLPRARLRRSARRQCSCQRPRAWRRRRRRGRSFCQFVGSRYRSRHRRTVPQWLFGAMARPTFPRCISGQPVLCWRACSASPASGSSRSRPAIWSAADIAACRLVDCRDRRRGVASAATVKILRRLVFAGMVEPFNLAIWNDAKRRSSLVGRHGPTPDTGQAATGSSDWALSLVVAAPHPDLMDLILRMISSDSRRSRKTSRSRRIATALVSGKRPPSLASATASMS